jgi:hypothetical protein
MTAATAYVVAASLVIWAITRTDPITMLMQVVDRRRAGGSTMWRANWPLDIGHVLGISDSTTLVVTAIWGLVLSFLVMWAFRKLDLVSLLGVASVFGYLWTVHFAYDDVMIAFLLIAIGHLALRESKLFNGIVFGLVGISLWLPPRISVIPYVRYCQLIVWTFALIYLLMKLRQDS